MQKVWGLVALMSTGWLGTIGCSATECEEAADKITDECELGGGYSLGPIVECRDDVRCRAECINEASCSEITDEEGNNDYTDCLADCAMQAQP